MAIDKIRCSSSDLYPYYEVIGEGGANNATDRVYKNWTVAELYAAYDALVTAYPDYISKTTSAYKDMSDTYDLVRYTFAPEHGYDKTMLITAGAHGSEKAGVLSLLRICQIICEKWKTNSQLAYLRNHVRLVIIPSINPWGFANNTMLNSNNTGNTGGANTNVNRNYDAYWVQVMSGGSDYSGTAPFSENESKWVRDTVIDYIGVKNLHYGIDMHDAPNATLFGDYWINYNTHNALQKKSVQKLVQYLVDKNISGREANIVHVCDTTTFGVFPAWLGKTLGIPSSTVEASYDSATWTADFMTLQIETRINAIIAAAITDFKTPEFLSDKGWFKLEYWQSFGEKEFNYLSGYNTFENVMGLWDALCTNYSAYATKSETYITTSDDLHSYTYTLSPKKYSKTVLIVSGRTYPGKDYSRFSKAMYKLAYLLCNYGNDEDHLAYIRNNVRLVFLPYIEYTSTSTDYLNKAGNFSASGVPNLSSLSASNIDSIVTGITGLNGVIYNMEETSYLDAIVNLETDAVFTLASQDSSDSLGVQDYADWLTEQGETVTVSATAASEFANYVYQYKSIPCVRIDTGIDHTYFDAHKTDYSGATEQETISAGTHLDYTHEISRRITNIVNVVKLMCK